MDNNANVTCLGFTVRVEAALLATGIRTIGDLREKTVADFNKIPNLSRKGLKEVLAARERLES